MSIRAELAFGRRWDRVAEQFGWLVVGFSSGDSCTFRRKHGDVVQIRSPGIIDDFESVIGHQVGRKPEDTTLQTREAMLSALDRTGRDE